MGSVLPRPSPLLALFLLGPGCQQAGISPASAQLSGAVPTVLFVSFSSRAAGVPSIRYGYDGILDQETPAGPTGKAWEDLAIIGLKAGRMAEWQPVVTLPDGTLKEGAIQTIRVPDPPPLLQALEVTIAEPDAWEPEPFHVLTQVASGDHSYVVILDRDGDVVWYTPSRNPTVNIVHTEMSIHGDAVLWAEFDRPELTQHGGVYRLSLDGTEETFTPMADGHHDMVELEGNRLAYLAFELNDLELDGTIGGPFPVQSFTVRSIEEGTTDNTYRTHFSLVDGYGFPPWYVCSHMHPDDNPHGFYQWDHANSLMRDPVSGDLVVLARNLDAILWIDPDSGEITRQIGGIHGVPFASGPFDHGHMTDIWDTGFMVFDNALHADRPSAMVEYALDRDTHTATEVWRYEEPNGKTMPVLSDADKLANGNYLGTWTKLGRINELTPDGRVVWQVESTAGGFMARAERIGDLYGPDWTQSQ